MLAEQTKKLFDFNYWAWDRVFPSIQKLSDTDYFLTRPIFFDSIHGLLVHCMMAEWLWFERVNGRSPQRFITPEDYKNVTEVIEAWQPIRQNWLTFVADMSDEDCLQIMPYQNSKGEAFELTLQDIMTHVVNHSTEHRSQMTPILFHADVATPPLDFLFFRLGY